MRIIPVTDKVYRGERPAKYTDLGHLKDLGIQYIINLESGAFEFFNDDDYEHACKGILGFEYFSLPCSDFCAPSFKQVERFISAIGTAHGPVFVHCLHGKDRTGFMIACYRMSQGWTYAQAKEEMIERGFHMFPYLPWLAKLRSYEKGL